MNDYKNKLKKIKSLLEQHNAKIIAHYYVDESLQRVAEDTGGFVSDSLQMARFGAAQNEQTLIVAGVMMAQALKIYKTALADDEFDKMLDAILRSREDITALVVPVIH